MIARAGFIVGKSPPGADTSATPSFEILLPSIERIASYTFRKVPRVVREDLIQETIANAYTAFVRLVARGLTALIYPSPLAQYAVRQVRDGRRVGQASNSSDVLSEYAQARRGIVVESLDRRPLEQSWEEQILADQRATPAELAACKLDFAAWLARLSITKRKLALQLAMGVTTSQAALRFRLSRARISQIRRELQADWDLFQGLTAAA